MTKLNKIPAMAWDDISKIPFIVRNALSVAKGSLDPNDYHTGDAWVDVHKALPLIERLCQPNIVIVDLDDEKLIDAIAGVQATGWEYGTHPRDKAKIVLAALAALKGNTND